MISYLLLELRYICPSTFVYNYEMSTGGVCFEEFTPQPEETTTQTLRSRFSQFTANDYGFSVNGFTLPVCPCIFGT